MSASTASIVSSCTKLPSDHSRHTDPEICLTKTSRAPSLCDKSDELHNMLSICMKGLEDHELEVADVFDDLHTIKKELATSAIWTSQLPLELEKLMAEALACACGGHEN